MVSLLTPNMRYVIKWYTTATRFRRLFPQKNLYFFPSFYVSCIRSGIMCLVPIYRDETDDSNCTKC